MKARSPAIRKALADHPPLYDILRAVDAQRGEEREDSLQRVLGVSPSQASGFSLTGSRDGSSSLPVSITGETGQKFDLSDVDMKSLRVLAEAVEGAVRAAKGRIGLLGLDWQDMEN
jgi:hypothetical protein